MGFDQGRNFGIMAGGGGDVLVLPDQKGVADVVPDGRTLLINFPQNCWRGEGGGVGGVW